MVADILHTNFVAVFSVAPKVTGGKAESGRIWLQGVTGYLLLRKGASRGVQT